MILGLANAFHKFAEWLESFKDEPVYALKSDVAHLYKELEVLKGYHENIVDAVERSHIAIEKLKSESEKQSLVIGLSRSIPTSAGRK